MFGQPLVIIQLGALVPIPLQNEDDGEGSQVGEQVGKHVEQGGPHAVFAAHSGSHGNHDITGVGNARIGQHSLDVVLDDGHHVADDHCQGGQGSHGRHPNIAHIGQGHDEDTQHGGKSGHLSSHRHKRSNDGGRTLVNVGRPHVEGGGGYFEAKSDQQEGDTTEENGIGR